MPGQQLKSTPEFVWLKPLHIDRVSNNCVQWHGDDYTLKARAEPEILARCDDASSLEEQRSSVLDDDIDVVWEIQSDGTTIWITFDSVQVFERPDFAQELTHLVDLFHRAMVQLPGHYGSQDHTSTVVEFRECLGEFLDHYRGLDQDDVARFVSKTGPELKKVERDLKLVLDLYT